MATNLQDGKLTLDRRIAMFQSIIRITFGDRQSALRSYFEKSISDVEQASNQLEHSDGLFTIGLLEHEFAARYLYPRKRNFIIGSWIVGILCMCLIDVIFGEGGVIRSLDKAGVWPGFFGPLAGHVIDYIPFRYVLYGATVGCLIDLTYKGARVKFDNVGDFGNLLTSPPVAFILTCAAGYILVRMAREGLFTLSIAGVTIDKGSLTGGAIFVLVALLSFAVEKTTRKLINMGDPEIK